MIARGGLSSEAFVPTSTVCSEPARSTCSATFSPGFTSDMTLLRSSGLRDLLAVRADDHVVGLEDPVRRQSPTSTALTTTPSARHLVAELAERDRRRDPLRRAHLREALLPLRCARGRSGGCRRRPG